MLKMRIVKRITALMAMAILISSLTGCGSFDTEDMAGASEKIEDITESVASGTDCEVALAPETPEETTPSPETYEDYMKLAAESYDRQEWETTLAFYQGAKELEKSREEVYRGISDVYLQMDDVAQALATLDEGIEKYGLDSFGQSTLHQRKTYVLAGTVAVRRKFIENSYDDDGNILSDCVSEYDENGNEIKSVYCRAGGGIGNVVEYQYDGEGNQIEYEYKSYNSDGNISIFSHETRAYDTNGNEIEYAEYDENGNMEQRREYGYDADGNRIRETDYDKNDEPVKRTETEYDAFGNEIQYMIYDQYGNCSLKIIKEYDGRGNQIKQVVYDNSTTIRYWYEREYDENDNEVKFIRYDDGVTIGCWIENEYDDFGSVIRQAMYKDCILKSEKQINYTYRYIGNIDAEVTEYMDDDVTLEEYNLKQREIFDRFLSGQEEIRYCSAFNSIGEGKIVRDTITDLIDFAYYEEDREALEYTFLDMTGDGIEELVINCCGDNLYIIQSDHGILKVIGRTVGGNFGTYLVKYDGRTGVCCNFGGHVGANEEIYYFYDGKGKQEISLSDYQDFQEDGTESRSYSIRDNDSFESRDISTGEYDDVSGMIIIITADWYPLEEPAR